MFEVIIIWPSPLAVLLKLFPVMLVFSMLETRTDLGTP